MAGIMSGVKKPAKVKKSMIKGSGKLPSGKRK